MAVVIDEVVGEVERSAPDNPHRSPQPARQEPPDVPALRVIVGRMMRRLARIEAD